MNTEDKIYFSSKTRKEMEEHVPGLKPEHIIKDAKEMEHEEYLKNLQEPDAVLVCLKHKLPGFEDSIQDVCAKCGNTIYYRPYNKNATKKICTDCADI